MTGPSRRPTIRDVAARAGVSTAVVSYVFSGRANRKNPAGPEVTERVHLAAAELGYTPNTNARSLKRQKTDRVCLAIEGQSSPWSDLLLETLQAAATPRGISVVLLPSRDRAAVARTRTLLQQGFADGVMIQTDDESLWSADDIGSVAAGGTAVVVMSDVRAAEAAAVYVRRAIQPMCETALTELVRQGRRRIAFFAHRSDLERPYSPRYRAYRAVLRRHHLRLDRSIVMAGAAEDRVAAYEAATTLIERGDIDTVFSASDRGAISALWALRDHGVAVPQQVAVLGFGNLPEGVITRPGLSSLGHDNSRMSEIADALFRQLDTGPPDSPQEIVIPAVISWRGST